MLRGSGLRRLANRLLGPAGLRLERDPAGARADAGPSTIDVRDGDRALAVWMRDDESRRWTQTPGWEAGLELRQLRALCRPGDRALDVGCNLGIMTLALQGAVGPTGHVVAVDADPWNVILTQATCQRNGIGNVTVVHAALAETDGGTLTIAAGLNAWVAPDAGGDGGLAVPRRSMAALAREHGPFDVIKVDVEGFEGGVLRGMGEALRPGGRLHLEWHGALIARYEDPRLAWQALQPERWTGEWYPREDESRVRPFTPDLAPPEGIATFSLTRRAGGPTR